MRRRLSKEEIAFNKIAKLPKKKKERKTPWINKCDKVFSEFIRERDKKCVKCGKRTGKADCSHVVSRAYKRLRYDPQNAKRLCFSCHKWWHGDPTESGIWYREKFPERWKYLCSVKYKPDVPLSIQELKDIFQKYSNLIQSKQ